MASSLFRVFRRYFGKPREWWVNLAMSHFFLSLLCFAIGLTVLQKVLKWPLSSALSVALLNAVMLASVGVVWLKKRIGALSSQSNPAEHNPVRTGLAEMRKMAGGFLIVALLFSGFAFGANDMGNATGIFVSATERVAGSPTMEVMFTLALLGSMGIAVGGFTWGYRVIRTAGYRVTKLNPVTGLAAEYSNALTIFLFTVIPFYLIGFGLPISTTHASIGSIIGVGLVARGLEGIHKHTVKKIFSTWALTIPCAALLSAGLYWTLSGIT
jgi:PiT family inorganic phosphate transporter